MENCNDNDFVNREIMIDCVVNCKHLKTFKKIYTNLDADLSIRFEAEEYHFTSFHHKRPIAFITQQKCCNNCYFKWSCLSNKRKKGE